MNLWYFAYGSNLLSEQMATRTEPIREGVDKPRMAILPNYEVAFNMFGSDGQFYANIIASESTVIGVLYRCSQTSIERLDGYEAGYERKSIVVTDKFGQRLEAEAYFALPGRTLTNGKPSLEYLQRILTGARMHGLPEEYVHALERRAARPPLPR